MIRQEYLQSYIGQVVQEVVQVPMGVLNDFPQLMGMHGMPVHLGHGIGTVRLLKTQQTLIQLGLLLRTGQQVYCVIQSIDKIHTD